MSTNYSEMIGYSYGSTYIYIYIYIYIDTFHQWGLFEFMTGILGKNPLW